MFKKETRILVIDDMATVRHVVTKALKELGFTDIQSAIDGNNGWDVLKKSSPAVELIISDWNMPNCTGLELLRKVRADEGYGKTPFVLLTAESETSQVAEALSSGVSNYILKPFTADMIRQKLEQTHKKFAV